MKWIGLFLILAITGSGINQIAKINSMKREAEKAYAAKDWDKAIAALGFLTDSLGVQEDEVFMNLGNAWLQKEDPAVAAGYYERILRTDNKQMLSRALQQLGVISQSQDKSDEALANFKAALKADPANEEARYNYELLKQIVKDKQDKENEKKEPSEYAKKLKEQADRLSAQNRFEQALQLMQKGLKEDETVSTYNDYIAKLNDVVESRK
ncbi:MAG: tetratricopeptide repeat protein [Cyclobacteriaceae bacterium]|nr:tetratricopeptide repeat protein [Cyclobacteriaceae bacterium]